ncbi:hypothetical protein JAAARDRAFT_37666 [Jaapia argillacea MUCL 33604]|uniref:Uncharacterized protein n=1 Tax=Jaapia argillacea MUCL 33604 TaxID=933084 RepID=A0A067PJR9_9AGAM|nr:hypothetical protein JAAARDRAFT_37666 [Jaapia argillacea MUCL 33604]
MYGKVLQACGWNITNYNFETLDVSGCSAVSDVLVNFFRDRVHTTQLDLIRKALVTVSNWEKVASFNSSSVNATKVGAAFSIGACRTVDGSVVLDLAYFAIKTTGKIDNVLSYSFGSERVECIINYQSMQLNVSQYINMRPSIENKLSSVSRTIDDLSLEKLTI